MEEYYFLFLIAFIYAVFASIQDLRKREVANWLNFSLIAFAFAYRLFYSIYSNNYKFVLFGALGFAIFFLLANVFYYSKIFAGGDAKLLMAFGAILPFQSYWDLLFLSIMFIFVLFLVGTVYSLIFSISLAVKNKEKFKKEFITQLKDKKYMLLLAIPGILFIILKLVPSLAYLKSWWFFASLFIIMPILYIYLEAVNKSCMIRFVNAKELTEGDWLERDVKIGNKTIRKSVHGLSAGEIAILRRAKKKVLVKYGVPFIPAFLLALIVMVFFFLTVRDFQSFFSSLF